MNKQIVEYEVKLEKSLKVILSVLAIGVLLNAFSPIMSVKNAFALNRCGGVMEEFYACNNGEWLKSIHDEVIEAKRAIFDIANGDCGNEKICKGRSRKGKSFPYIP